MLSFIPGRTEIWRDGLSQGHTGDLGLYFPIVKAAYSPISRASLKQKALTVCCVFMEIHKALDGSLSYYDAHVVEKVGFLSSIPQTRPQTAREIDYLGLKYATSGALHLKKKGEWP